MRLKELSKKLRFGTLHDVFYCVQYFAVVRGVARNSDALSALNAMKQVVFAVPNGTTLIYGNIDALCANLPKHRNEWMEEDSTPYSLGNAVVYHNRADELPELFTDVTKPVTQSLRENSEIADEMARFMSQMSAQAKSQDPKKKRK